MYASPALNLDFLKFVVQIEQTALNEAASFIALRTLYAELDHRSKAKVRLFFSLHSIELKSDLEFI